MRQALTACPVTARHRHRRVEVAHDPPRHHFNHGWHGCRTTEFNAARIWPSSSRRDGRQWPLWVVPHKGSGVWTSCRLNGSQSRRECISQTRANPEGISSFSPGLRAARYPGCVSPSTPPTLKGLHRLPSHHRQSLACRSVEKTVRIRILAGDCARAAIMDQGAGDSDKIPSLAAASPQNVQTPERQFRYP